MAGKLIEERVSDLAIQIQKRADKLRHNPFLPTNTLHEGAAGKALGGLLEEIEKLAPANTPQDQKALTDAYAQIKANAEVQYRAWVEGKSYDEKQWKLNFGPMKQLVLGQRLPQLTQAVTNLQAFLNRPIPAPVAAVPQGAPAGAQPVAPTQAELDAHAAKEARRVQLLATANANLATANDLNNANRQPALTAEERVDLAERLLKSTKELSAQAHSEMGAAAPAVPADAKLDGLLDNINKTKDETQKSAMTELERSLKARNDNQKQTEIRHFRMLQLLGDYEHKLVRATGRPLPPRQRGQVVGGTSEHIKQLEQAMEDLKSGAGGSLSVGESDTHIEYRGGSFTLPRMGNSEASKFTFNKRLDAVLNVAVLNADTEPTTPPAAPPIPSITYECASKEAVDMKELVRVIERATEKGVQVELGPNVWAKVNNMLPGEISGKDLKGYYEGRTLGADQFIAFYRARNEQASRVNDTRYEQVMRKVAALDSERAFQKTIDDLKNTHPPVAAAPAPAAPGAPPPPPPQPLPETPAEIAAREAKIIRILPEAIQKLQQQLTLIEQLQAVNPRDREIESLVQGANQLKQHISDAMANNNIQPVRPAQPALAAGAQPRPATVTDRFHDEMRSRGVNDYSAVKNAIDERLVDISAADAQARANPHGP